MLERITSNKINELRKKLIIKIKGFKEFFKTPFCVFNNQNMEKWFKTLWIKEEQDILMNIKFKNLNDAIELFSDGGHHLATTDDVNYALLSLCLDGKVKDNYFLNDDQTIDSPRVRSYCSEMTKVFMDASLNQIIINDKVYDSLKDKLKENNILMINDFIASVNFKNINAPIYIFNVKKLEKAYYDFIDELSKNNEVYLFELDDNLEKESNTKIKTHFIKAPSELREVEAVHSKICDLFKNGVTYSDITIYAPSVGEYVETITRVFKQSESSDNGVKEKYLDIPYVVKTSMTRDSNITKALEILLDIIHKGFYTRLDIYKLASNGLIKTVRNISFDDLEAIDDAMINMNLFRSIDLDFIKGKKRLLATKLVGDEMTLDNVITIDGKSLIPYGNMNLSDDVIWKFSSLVDDLDCLLKLKDDNNYLNNLANELDKWFSIKDYNDMETNKLYSKILSVIEGLEKINNISIDIVFNYLIEASRITKSTKGEVLTSGVTFLDINDGVVIPNKYVFLMGMSSSAFPREDKRTEFYNLNTPSSEEIDKATFNKIINNAGELYFSYAALDVKKDSPFYPTILFDDLINNNSFDVSTKYNEEDEKDEIVMEEISLDETRPYSELYTRREFKKKEHFLDLFKTNKKLKGKNKTKNNIVNNSVRSFDNISLDSLAKFLKEPLMEKTNKLMKVKKDKYDDLKTEFNSLSFEALYKTIYTSDLIQKLLIEIKNNIDANKDFDYLSYLENETCIDVKNNLIKLMKITDDVYGDSCYNGVLKTAKGIVKDYITSISPNYEIYTIPEITINNNGDEWKLTNSRNYYRFVDGDKRTYAMLKEIDEKDIGDYISQYLFSLMDVVSDESEDLNKAYSVCLYGKKKNSRESGETIFSIEYDISKQEAIDYLNTYHDLYGDYSDNLALPLSALEKDDVNKPYDLYKLLLGGEWKNEYNKKLFDRDKQLGFDSDSFKNEWEKARQKQLDLLKLLKIKLTKKEEQ